MSPRRDVLLFFIIFGALAAITVFDLAWQATLDGPNTTGEAGKVFYARKAQVGEPLCPQPDAPPYYPAIHGALLHWSVGFLGRQLSSDVDGLYAIGRTLTIVLTIMAVSLACRVLRELGCSVAQQFAFVVLVFAPFEIVQHSASYRPDNWNLCLSILACFLLLTQREQPWSLASLTILPAIAFFVKAPGICLIAPIALSLSLKGKPLTGIACGAGSLALTVGCVLALNQSSDGLFMANLRGGVGVPRSAAHPFVMLFGSPLVLLTLLAPVVFSRGIVMNFRQEGEAWRLRALGAFWLTSMLVSLVSSMRSGSNIYYFLQPFVYACLILVVRFRDARLQRRGVIVRTAFWTYLFAGAALIPTRLASRPTNNAIDKTLAFVDARRDIADAVNRQGLACYSDDEGLNARLDNPKVLYPYVHNALVESGYLPADTALDPVRRQEYDLIVLTGIWLEHQGIKGLTPEFFQALEQSYKQKEESSGYQVYVPRQ